MFRVSSTFEFKSFDSVLVFTEKPPDSEHSFSCYIFSKPELEDNKEDNKLNVISFLEEHIGDLGGSK